MANRAIIRGFNNKKIVFLRNTRLKRQTQKFDLETLVSHDNISTFSPIKKIYHTSATTEHFIIIQKDGGEITFNEDGTIHLF
ncbi:MAG: hypothetical protein IPJ01_11760 [Micavibrio sp.]|nr:hypothetical protein [Micavibrio sp.]